MFNKIYFSSFSFFFLVLVFQRNFETKAVKVKTVKSCECGKGGEELEPRIVGGKAVKPEMYPWNAVLMSGNTIMCGGTLINDRYIVTAGHCVKWMPIEEISLHLKVHNKQNLSAKIEIESILIHENFKSNSIRDIADIALIKLKQPVTFTEDILPICLPTGGENYTLKWAEVVGWGRLSKKGRSSTTLNAAKVIVISMDLCQKVKAINEHLEETMLCAYHESRDACQGDSGGPLLYEKPNGAKELIGIVSWGIGCATPGIPGVYTRITSYVDWITSHTTDALYCKAS